jgi:hypothetical protein
VLLEYVIIFAGEKYGLIILVDEKGIIAACQLVGLLSNSNLF